MTALLTPMYQHTATGSISANCSSTFSDPSLAASYLQRDNDLLQVVQRKVDVAGLLQDGALHRRLGDALAARQIHQVQARPPHRVITHLGAHSKFQFASQSQSDSVSFLLHMAFETNLFWEIGFSLRLGVAVKRNIIKILGILNPVPSDPLMTSAYPRLRLLH